MDVLRELLSNYQPADSEEAVVQKRFIDLIDGQPDCLLRSCMPGHLTASAWVVEESSARFLLHHHRKLGRWLQLGGHADGSADLLGVACKEVEEESGLAKIEPISKSVFDLDIHRIPARGSEPEHLHFDVRFLLRAPAALPVCSKESYEVSWLTAAQVHNLVDDLSVLRLLNKWERAHNSSIQGG